MHIKFTLFLPYSFLSVYTHTACQLMLQNVLTAAAADFPVAKCRLLPALSFIDRLPMPLSPLSLFISPLPHSHSGFTTRHSQSANPLAAAKLSLVVVTHCVLVMRHTQLCSLLRLSVCPLSPLPFAVIVLVVGCFVSSVNVCVYVCVCLCFQLQNVRHVEN